MFLSKQNLKTNSQVLKSYSKICSLERENENLNKELHEKTKELLAGMSEKSELMQNVAEIEYTNAHFGALEAVQRHREGSISKKFMN